MLWPIVGEIVMPFSQTALIRDVTFGRYQTNDNMRIEGREGDPVRAVADGRVVGLGRDFFRGYYVTIDHGNGWLSTVGQLMENALVSEGDIVRGGEIIGGVGRPSDSASLLGTHTHLHITHDGVPMNPYYLLEDREE